MSTANKLCLHFLSLVWPELKLFDSKDELLLQEASWIININDTQEIWHTNNFHFWCQIFQLAFTRLTFGTYPFYPLFFRSCPFRICSSSFICPVDVRWWIPPTDLQRTNNGYKTETERTSTVKTDAYRTFNGHFIRLTSVQSFEHANGLQWIKRTQNGYKTDMDGPLTNTNGRQTDMNGMIKSYSFVVRSVRCDRCFSHDLYSNSVIYVSSFYSIALPYLAYSQLASPF